MTLVVHGDLASQAVTDARRQYSGTLVRAAWERDRGFHVCVVDAEGFTDLLAGHSARCRELLRLRGEAKEKVMVLSQPGDGVLGGPLRRHASGRHDPAELILDLNLLDEGTEAHESTLTALVSHLADQGIEVRGHARKAPRFDAGWTRGDDVFVAEVKSLSPANEVQQIRLGIGQVLDYADQVQHQEALHRVRPTLVLERQPTDPRWRRLADSHGILLTWGPNFEGC
ncbi:hypothetical protein ITX44_28975 [Streptomyces sp. KK5PA1]|uniref:Endonuclease NucS n=1 Tax=Actinacidiphila acididurans TaxID=2784346 RepID=A0ABS2TYV4_9ACTN|nr:hypothetical protein [Actinacidiphila acididurans]